MKNEATIHAFLREIGHFDHGISGIDRVWELIFPDRKGKWNTIRVVRYKRVFYIYYIDGNNLALEVGPGKTVRTMESPSIGFSSYTDDSDDPARSWESMIASARDWMKTARKDWIAANKRVRNYHDASLPIAIADPEAIRKRLLGQDNIGIIPAYDSLHRANQHFREDQCVYDVLHYDDLGRYKRKITLFITWEPLPILKPN
jgi:hypothetical protein